MAYHIGCDKMENVHTIIQYVNNEETIGSNTQTKIFQKQRLIEINYNDYTVLEINNYDFKPLAQDIKALLKLSEYGNFKFENGKSLFISAKLNDDNSITYIRHLANPVRLGSFNSGNFQLKLLDIAFTNFKKRLPVFLILEKSKPLTIMQGAMIIAIAGIYE
jgi:hypothetical protein